jgi:hypothetical protein
MCCRGADASREVLDLLAEVAAALSAGNAGLFLKAFDPAMAGFAKLREQVTGLVAQGALESVIDPEEDEGDGRRRVVRVDWTLRVQRGVVAANYSSREQVVTFTVEKQGRRWRIVAMEPSGFFAPAE